MEVFLNPIKLSEASFGERPQALNTVHVNAGSHLSRFIADLLFDAQMLVKANIDQPIIAAPPIANHNTLHANLATYNAL